MNKSLNSDGFFEARRVLDMCKRWNVNLGVRQSVLKALVEKPIKAGKAAQKGSLAPALPPQPAAFQPKRLDYFSDKLWKELLLVYNNGSSNTNEVKGGTQICRKRPVAVRKRVYITP